MAKTAEKKSSPKKKKVRPMKPITNVVVYSHPDSHHVPAEHGICGNCRNPIQIMVYRGLGYCSEKCRKALRNNPEETHGG